MGITSNGSVYLFKCEQNEGMNIKVMNWSVSEMWSLIESSINFIYLPPKHKTPHLMKGINRSTAYCTSSFCILTKNCLSFSAVSHLHNSVALKNLLTYCMMSGWDCWDVIILLKHQHDGKTYLLVNIYTR